jgi:hypothetical protein
MDGFVRVVAGVTSPPDFFNPDNINRIFAAASRRNPRGAREEDSAPPV